MPFSTMTLIIALLLVSHCLHACRIKEDVEKSDYHKLKNMLLRLSKQPEDLMPGELERHKTLELRSERVSEIRTSCYEAYNKFFVASQLSGNADKLIDNIKASMEQHKDPEEILGLKQKAESMLEESNRHLEQATRMKETCYALMEEMEKPRH
ncbi:MAG: hypothetical protein ABIJ56_01965 [Pseudomonadota bacterium]